jgi:hypothetical protein
VLAGNDFASGGPETDLLDRVFFWGRGGGWLFCIQANPEMVKDLQIIPAGVSDSPPYLSFSKCKPPFSK